MSDEHAAMRQREQELQAKSNDIGICASIAHLWKSRVAELAAAGRAEDAINAYHRGAEWAFQYAASATSGGEGIALSLERDAIIKELRRQLGNLDPGEDPDRRRSLAAIGETLKGS